MLEAVVVDVLVVDVVGVDVLVAELEVLVVPPPDAADCPVPPLPSPAPPVPPRPPPVADPAPPGPPPPAPAGTNGRKTTGRELGAVCATAGRRYGRSAGTAGIGVNDFTVTPAGGVLCVVGVAGEPGASVDGPGVVRVTVVVVCEGIRPPSA